LKGHPVYGTLNHLGVPDEAVPFHPLMLPGSEQAAKEFPMFAFRKWFGRSSQAIRYPTRRPRSFRPEMESLEDRKVLSPAVTPYFDPASGQYQLQVWAIGADGNLYNEWYNGAAWQPWSGFGNPGVPLTGSPAVTVYDDPATGQHQLQVWAIGADGNLY